MTEIDFNILQRLNANLKYLDNEVGEAHRTLTEWGAPMWITPGELLSVGERIDLLATTIGDLIPSIAEAKDAVDANELQSIEIDSSI